MIVDLLLRHGVDVVAFNPGASFRGIHDSVVHRGAPRPVLCLHEEIAVAVAHGYAKAAGRPMAVLIHDVVGLQHATMAIYNAWVDRVPMLLVGGTGPRSTPARRPWVDWVHTAAMQANLIRDYVKWDDEPADLASVPASLARAFSLTRAVPAGPVYVNFDVGIQEELLNGEAAGLAADQGHLTTGAGPTSPGPTAPDLAWLAAELRTAQTPIIVTDYAGASAEGFQLLQRVAERSGAAVVDAGDRLNFPTPHPQNASDLPDALEGADLVLALEVEDIWGRLRDGVYVDDGPVVTMRPGVQVVDAGTGHLRTRSWAGDHQRFVPVDRRITTGAVPLLAGLEEALAADPVPMDVRARRLEAISQRTRMRREARTVEAAASHAEDGVVHPARIAAALWPFIRERNWMLAHGTVGGWERILWDFQRPSQHIGWHGGGGLGYGAGASIGAALALGDETLCIDLQPDGDLLFTPQALWTAARERLRILFVVLNNRQYANTVGHARAMADARERDVSKRHIGAAIDEPAIDIAALSRSQGVAAFGPVGGTEDLVEALSAAIAVTDAGGPALVEILTPRI